MPSDVNQIETTGRHGSRMICPECGHAIPITPQGECDRCGAHVEVVVRTVVPAVGE